MAPTRSRPLAFIEMSVDRVNADVRETGPALWPVAMPVWCSGIAVPHRLVKARRAPLLMVIAAVHLFVITFVLAQRGTIDLTHVQEQSRLTLIRIAQTMNADVEQEPEVAAEPTEDMAQTTSPPSSPIEWSRVPNWRLKGSGTAAASAGNGNGYDATRLLAGLGASGPAGASDGVADPYAGASPVWAGNGAKSSLLLIGAPNPAVLEQVRQLVTRSFHGMQGVARMKVAVDRDGVVTRVVEMKSDLPRAARELLELTLVGRVVSAPQAKEGIVDLPSMLFA